MKWLRFPWRRTLLCKRDHVALPPPMLRAAGPLFKGDRAFRNFATSDVALMERHTSLAGKRILDFGCGSGRLYFGLTQRSEPSSYLGADIRSDSIVWARRHIASANPRFSFRQIDIQHDRYNPGGTLNNDAWRDAVRQQFDVIYSYSVLSHLAENEAHTVLSMFAERLPVDGWLFVTAFVAEQAENVVINPADAGFSIKGPLHVVRYRSDYFRDVMLSSFNIVADYVGAATDGQTFFVAQRRALTSPAAIPPGM